MILTLKIMKKIYLDNITYIEDKEYSNPSGDVDLDKIVVDETNIEFSEIEKVHLEKIYQIDQPVNQLFLKRGKVIKIVFGVIASLLAFNILRNNFVLLFNLLNLINLANIRIIKVTI